MKKISIFIVVFLLTSSLQAEWKAYKYDNSKHKVASSMSYRVGKYTGSIQSDLTASIGVSCNSKNKRPYILFAQPLPDIYKGYLVVDGKVINLDLSSDYSRTNYFFSKKNKKLILDKFKNSKVLSINLDFGPKGSLDMGFYLKGSTKAIRESLKSCGLKY